MERYYVYQDLQNTDFAMGRCYTIEQWRKQALEWCYIDENYDLAEILYNMKNEYILDAISELWALIFRKCRKDRKHFSKDDLNDFEDETLEEFYNKRFKE
jgi:hypothetical protein